MVSVLYEGVSAMTSLPASLLSRFGVAWNRFFHSGASPAAYAMVRIGFGMVIGITFLTGWVDAQKWFGPNGMVSYEASRAIVDPDTLTLFQLFPAQKSPSRFCSRSSSFRRCALCSGFMGGFRRHVCLSCSPRFTIATMPGVTQRTRLCASPAFS